MGVILCSSTDPAHAMRIEELGIRVRSAEELCYCVLHYPLLFLEDLVGETLFRFLARGAGEPGLALELKQLRDNRVRDEDILVRLLEGTGYLSGPELGAFRTKIQELKKLPAPEYLKQKADQLFSLRKYGRAVLLYDRILSMEEGAGVTLSLRGKVLTNKGSACANLFLSEQAYRCYMEAYKLLHDEQILKEIWFLSLTEPVIGIRERYQETVHELAGREDLSDWDAEYEAARQKAAAGPKKSAVSAIFENDPVQRMNLATAAVQQWKKEYRGM